MHKNKILLQVSHLTKKFGDFTAVNDISFTLREGEILGFLGPNGAGKTTTIQMLLAVLHPTQGSIVYFGKSIEKNRAEILEQINFSSTYTNLPWQLTVLENLKFISYLYTISNRPVRIEKIIQLFNLKPILKQKILDLSAGEVTRVNLAKAFLNNPKILLLDEPTASLDPDVADYVRTFLLEEKKNSKLSIILTSHNMSEVEEMCDRVIFIREGRIVADDTPEQLAKTIEIAHLRLVIVDGIDRLIAYARDNKISHVREFRSVFLDIREKDIAPFLVNLPDIGVQYSEISIEKPTLQDYFLAMSKDI